MHIRKYDWCGDNNEQPQQQQKQLSIQQLRPESLKQAIDQEFADVSQYNIEFYGFNRYGAKEYCFLTRFDPWEFIKNLVFKQDKVIIVDVGAGNGLWGKEITQKLKNIDPINFGREGKEIIIYSLTGESLRNFKEEVFTEIDSPHEHLLIGNMHIKHYLLGPVKIEDVSETLMGKQLRNKVDLIVSKCCLVHLCDPAGTIIQLRDLLKPGSGLMAADGSSIVYDKGDKWSTFRLLLTFGDPFIAQKHKYGVAIIFKRVSTEPVTIEYLEKANNHEQWTEGSKKRVARLKCLNPQVKFNKSVPSDYILGNSADFWKELISMIPQEHSGYLSFWHPLLEGSQESRFEHLAEDPLFTALRNVKEDNGKSLSELIAQKSPQELGQLKDRQGLSFIYNIIAKGYLKILLESSKELDLTTYNHNKKNILHEVADFPSKFYHKGDITLLYQHFGASWPKMVEQTDKAGMTPLLLAVENHNSEVAKFLAKHGAIAINK